MGSCCSSERSQDQSYPKSEEALSSAATIQAQESGPLKPLLQDFSIQYRVVEKLTETASHTLSIIEHKTSHIQRVLRRVMKSDDSAASNHFRAGVRVLQDLDHPNVTRLYEAYEDRKYFYMVYERVQGSSVLDYLSFSKSYTEQSIGAIISQVLAGLSYCHARHVLHKNLYVQNLLLLKHHSGLQVKLIGLESQGLLSTAQRVSMTRAFVPYAAPEMFSQVYTEKGDVWSCGVIMYLLLSGSLPFAGKTTVEQRAAITTQQLLFPRENWLDVSVEAKDLLSAMLARDPNCRPTSLQCLESPWVAGNSKVVSVEVAEIPLGRLQSFNGNMQVKETILSFVSKHLQSTGDNSQVEEVFRNLDTNKDGRLSSAELIAGYSQVMGEAQAEEMVRTVMQAVDLDNSGFVDFSEFLFAASDPLYMLSTSNLRELFGLFDHDHDGTISIGEFEHTLGLSKASRSVWKEIIAQADVSGDGKLTLSEFSGLLHRAIGSEVKK